jgi:hypothetical protein
VAASCLYELGTVALLGRGEVHALIAARESAEELGALATTAILDIELVAGYFGLDDPDGERRYGLQAVHRASELGMDLIAAYRWLHVSGAATLTSDRVQAERAAAEARAAAPGNRDIDGLLLAAEAVGALAANDLRRAFAWRSTGVSSAQTAA